MERPQDTIILDAATRRNLELTKILLAVVITPWHLYLICA